MPYEVRGKCVYKKDGGAKVGCTKGSVKDYLAALHANANESVEIPTTQVCDMFNITESNKLKGGKADKMTVKDIANKFGVSVSSIEKQLAMGKKIEHEHTDNLSKAIEIAMDHLSEFPDYYTRLIKMEKEAEKHAKKREVKENVKPLIKRLLREQLF